MRTLVVGLGNPILGDDGVGWRVAEAVRQQNCWWVEAATFCSTRKFLSAKQAGGNAYTEKLHIL
jgi:Ni,Fe-hydrogenase maturation factor